ncbi:CSD domain-containing protein [Tumidithrix helvetica PCC 7403]|uniref:cold shock domain-containing protein n=1 Tax=Tumidithrix helvetica TaxID=3457545 RepID=UPI003C982979
MKPDLNKGQLIKWNDDRGFGFIKSGEGGKEVFLHISAVKTTGRRPKVGDTIFYALITAADGRIRASDASIQGVVSQSSTTQKLKPTPTKRKVKKFRVIETILGIGGVAAIVLFQMQFRPNRLSTPTSTPITAIATPSCVVKGNISIATGDKLYHVPGMEDYDGTIVDSAKGERWFCSEAEAVAAGWRKAPR